MLEGSAALDALFRHQMTDLLATRLLVAHAGSPVTVQPVTGGLSPKVLCRAIERLRSDSNADVSLAALASDAGLSRFHFCRAFKGSTGLSPYAWLRQHQLEQAMNMLRDTDDSIVSIAAALGYSSQTAFAAAFRKLTGKRVFRMAPLHHHFELVGWSEPKVFARFLIVAIVFALVSLATLKLR